MKSNVIPLRLTPRTLALLDELAKKLGRSRSEAMRAALQVGLPKLRKILPDLED